MQSQQGNVICNFHLGAKKIEVSEVFDAKRAPPIVLVTQRATETTLEGLQPSDILYQPKTTNLNEP